MTKSTKFCAVWSKTKKKEKVTVTFKINICDVSPSLAFLAFLQTEPPEVRSLCMP